MKSYTFELFLLCVVWFVIGFMSGATPPTTRQPCTAPIILWTEHDTNVGTFAHNSPDWGGAAAYAAWIRQEAIAVVQDGKLITIVNPKPIPYNPEQ